MSETASPYIQQGWYGPAELVAAAKAALSGQVQGMLPPIGEPPELTDEDGSDAMFGFVALSLLPVPEGLKRASPIMLVRMMGSSF
jgi:hypothetical protein